MELPIKLQNKIIDFLKSLPNIDDTKSRQAFIYSAGLDQELNEQIPFDEPPAKFVPLLVSILLKYGKLKDGRNALEAVLEAAKNYVGHDRQAKCEIILQQLRTNEKAIGFGDNEIQLQNISEYSHDLKTQQKIVTNYVSNIPIEQSIVSPLQDIKIVEETNKSFYTWDNYEYNEQCFKIREIIDKLRPRLLTDNIDFEFVEIKNNKVDVRIIDITKKRNSGLVVRDQKVINKIIRILWANGCYMNLFNEEACIFSIELRSLCIRCPMSHATRGKICQICSRLSFRKQVMLHPL